MHANPGSPPRPSSVLRRQRLIKRLKSVVAPGIVVVTAPAACGKSMLIADYLQTIDAPSIWVHLGPEDNDHRHLDQHISRLFQSWLNHEKRLPQTPEARHASIPDAGAANLVDRLPDDLRIIFDGCQHIAASPRAVNLIEAVLAVRPPRGCVYLLSRETLPIKMQRSRMQRQALFLTDIELAFTEAEINAYFQTIHGISLDAGRGRQIRDLTDGWVGGLHLVSEELHRRPEAPDAILDAATLPERIRTEAYHYFEEVIYRQQSPTMKAFLVSAAQLDTVPANLMRDHLGTNEADQLFDEAIRRHLFLHVITADQDRWSFRFNPLFRTFLRARSTEILPPEQTRKLLREAARRCQAGGDLETAVPYFLRAGEIDFALRDITAIGLKLSFAGRFTEIAHWTGMLPASVVAEDPWLGLLHAMVYRIRGGRRTISELQAARRAFARADRFRGQMLALAYMIETAVFVGYDPAERRQWIADAEDLLNQTRHLSHFTYAKALLWQQIGLGSIAATTGDLHKGLSACQNAAILGKRIGAYSLVSNALSIAAHAHVQAGDFTQAEEHLQALQPINASGVFQEYGVLHDLARSHLAIVRGDLTSAADQLKQVEADIDALGLIALYPAFLEASGLLQIYGKHFGTLEKTHRHLQDVATLLNNPLYKSLAFWLAGLSCYHQGRFPSALALARQAATLPDRLARPVLLGARNRQLKGFIALNTGQFEKANAHFQRALHYFDDAGLGLSACETRIGRALAHNALQDEAAMRHDLQAAFQTANRQNYQHFPVIRPADLARACVLCINREIPAAAAHARHLLATRLADTDTQILDASPHAGALARSIDNGDTHNAIYRARIPVIAIRTLGGLQVLRHGREPIRAREWRGSRPALLFKAILVHGGRHIPKDMLIEALWPDRHPDKSLQNFKVTLHRLRKLLEPDLNPALGSAYIHLQDNLVSLDQHLCEVDTVAFHRLCQQFRVPDPGMSPQDLVEICRKAFALYQGDFLPEEPYLPWAEMKRTTLREEFIQLMYRLGERLNDENEFATARRCYRRIIRFDPTQEKAQRRLMRLLAHAGRAQEALRHYRDFRSFLQTEIGAVPETATVQLYQSIRDN